MFKSKNDEYTKNYKNEILPEKCLIFGTFSGFLLRNNGLIRYKHPEGYHSTLAFVYPANHSYNNSQIAIYLKEQNGKIFKKINFFYK